MTKLFNKSAISNIINYEHIDPSSQIKVKSKNQELEGKFGVAKVAYGLNRIRQKLKSTSESTISLIFLAMNLVKSIRFAFFYFFLKICKILDTGFGVRGL